MSLLTRLAGGRDVESRSVTFDDVWGAPAQTTHAGIAVDAKKALENRAVFGSISVITEGISTLPIHGFNPDGNKRMPLEHEPRWLARGFNPEVDVADGVAQLLVSLLADGNGYVVPSRYRGDVVELFPQDPTKVNIDRERAGGLVYDVHDGATHKVYRAAAGEMIHVRGLRWPGAIKGLAPITLARQAIGLGIAAEQFAALFFGQGANAGGVLEAPGDLDDGQAKKLARSWLRAHSGLRKAHLPAVLTGGLKWQKTGFAPEEAQMIETRRFQIEEICGFYRVAPWMVGELSQHASQGGGNGIEAQGIQLITYTLRPWITRLEQALLPAVRGISNPHAELRFNVAGLLRGDSKSRYEAYALARQWGWLCVDDILALEDLPPLPDGKGQAYLQPLNMVTAGGDQGLAMDKAIAAASALIRSGFDPQAALEAVGLDPITHLGLLPATVQKPDDAAVAADLDTSEQ